MLSLIYSNVLCLFGLMLLALSLLFIPGFGCKGGCASDSRFLLNWLHVYMIFFIEISTGNWNTGTQNIQMGLTTFVCDIGSGMKLVIPLLMTLRIIRHQ